MSKTITTIHQDDNYKIYIKHNVNNIYTVEVNDGHITVIPEIPNLASFIADAKQLLVATLGLTTCSYRTMDYVLKVKKLKGE